MAQRPLYDSTILAFSHFFCKFWMKDAVSQFVLHSNVQINSAPGQKTGGISPPLPPASALHPVMPGNCIPMQDIFFARALPDIVDNQRGLIEGFAV